MELRELLEFYQAYAELELKDEEGNVIDWCRNGNLIKGLWGSRKVIKIFPQNNYITVVLKDKEGKIYEKGIEKEILHRV